MHEVDKTKLTDQTKFRLYEIKSIENDFINEHVVKSWVDMLLFLIR